MHRAADNLPRETADPPLPRDVRRAIEKLTSLHDGDLGVIEAIACGPRAIAALRAVLFAREPSGLYDSRRRAVAALAQLHAYDSLIEYLSDPRAIGDPVEQTGDEAVINAAARALGESGDARALPLLLEFTKRSPLAGVVEALGKLRRADALPYFIKALAEDFTRPAAEAAIRKLGRQARPALIEAASARSASDTQESASSRRQRRSALGLFADLARPDDEHEPAVHDLMRDRDAAVAALACQIELARSGEATRDTAIRRLIELLPAADWLLRREIEDCLTKRYDAARTIIEDALRHSDIATDVESAAARTERMLRRIVKRAAP